MSPDAMRLPLAMMAKNPCEPFTGILHFRRAVVTGGGVQLHLPRKWGRPP